MRAAEQLRAQEGGDARELKCGLERFAGSVVLVMSNKKRLKERKIHFNAN